MNQPDTLPELPRTAADWRARLESVDASEVDWNGFTSWLEENPARRSAWDGLDAAMEAVEFHKPKLLIEGAATVTTRGIIKKVVRLSAWTYATAFGALAASVLGIFLLTRTAPEIRSWKTSTGERREVALSDGSTIHLNTATSILISFDGDKRAARLDKGEAMFEIAPNSQRPFLVDAGDQHIRVVGTAFSVLRQDGTVEITVSRGVVQATVKGAGDPGTRLTAGAQYQRREGQTAYTVSQVDTTAAMSWLDGRLSYDDVQLSKVVADLNRNFDTQILLGDNAVGKLRFSGVLKIEDVRQVVRRLEGLLPIASHPQGNDIVLMGKAGG